MLAHARTVVCARAHAIALADALTRARANRAISPTEPSPGRSAAAIGAQLAPTSGGGLGGKGRSGKSQVTMTKGGGISPQLYVPQEVWLQEGAKCVRLQSTVLRISSAVDIYLCGC